MHVRVHGARLVKIHHGADVLDVQAARGNVRRHDYLQRARLELAHAQAQRPQGNTHTPAPGSTDRGLLPCLSRLPLQLSQRGRRAPEASVHDKTCRENRVTGLGARASTESQGGETKWDNQTPGARYGYLANDVIARLLRAVAVNGQALGRRERAAQHSV